MFDVEALARNVWLISPLSAPIYPYSNSMYIEDERVCIIDFGSGKAFDQIEHHTVQLGLISHFHFDHLHCIGNFSNIDLYAGKEERETYSDEISYIKFHGYDLWEEIMPGIPRDAYGKVIPLANDVPVQPGFRQINLMGTFEDQERIDLGKRSILAVHLPGHTRGHYGFYLEEEGILFSGDIDLVPSGPWYNSASGDVGDLIRSVQKIKEINPSILVPSHRRIQVDDIAGQLGRYIQVVLNREDALFDLLKQASSIDDLASKQLVFPNPKNIYECFWEKMTIRNHLIHLIALGAVIKTEDGLYRQC